MTTKTPRPSVERWSLLAAALSLFLPPLPASAQPAAESAASLIDKGAAAATAGQYEDCVKAYSTALKLRPESYPVAAELGICEAALGQLVEAYDHLLYSLNGEVQNPPGHPVGIWKRYREAFERVTQRVARVFLTVQPPEAEVFLDGRSVGTFASGRHFGVLPGKHTWTARLEGYDDPAPVRHSARAGDLPDVVLILVPHPPPEPAAVAAPPPVSVPVRVPAPTPWPAPEPPCKGAMNVRMSPDMCRLFSTLYRKKMDPTLMLLAGGIASVGFTADVAPGFWLGGEARWRDKEEVGFQLGLEFRTLLPATGSFRSTGQPLTVSLVALALSPCGRYKWVSGCAVVDAGLSIAGGPPPLSFDKGPLLFMLGMGPRLAVDIPINERFGVRAFADLRFSPLRSDLGYPDLSRTDGKVAGWRHPPVSGILGLGMSFK
jgi:hypothetical protein